MLLADQELRELAAQTDSLLAGIEALPDRASRERAIEAIQSLVQLYGAGLSRIATHVTAHDPHIFEELASDELIGHLLILHGLHPLDVDTRVRQALDDVRPYLQSHGGNVDLVGIDDGRVLVRLEGTCHGCPSSAMTLKLAIEESVQRRAPELDGVEAVNAAPGSNGFVPLASLRSRPNSNSGRGSWTLLTRAPVTQDGAMSAREVDDVPILFLRLDGTLFAYHNACPNCGGALDEGTLNGPILICANCNATFDVRQAGRSPDSPAFHLEPVPLLRDGDRVQVAIQAAAS